MGDWGNDSRDDDPEVEISAKIGCDESEDDLKVDATALAENGCDDSADEVDTPGKNGRDKDDPLRIFISSLPAGFKLLKNHILDPIWNVLFQRGSP